MPDTSLVKLGLVDDHKLFRKGLRSLIERLAPGFNILFEADNGLDLQEKINSEDPPEIILMDVNMPVMNGFDSVQWLSENYPNIKILVVSMIEKEEVIVKMLKLGVKGYLSKDVEPNELKLAIETVAKKDFYYTDFITGKLVHSLRGQENNLGSVSFESLNDRERDFIKLACTELTYQEIADKMFVSPKTVDGYRSTLFDKLKVKNRVGLAMHAVRNEWVNL